MIKHWQKTSLGVVAGLTVYTGFLTSVVAYTKQANEKAKEQAALQARVNQDEQVLAQLKKSLYQVQGHTSEINKQITAAQKNISTLRAGKLVAGIKVPANLLATTHLVSNVAPVTPQTQTVSRASGK